MNNPTVARRCVEALEVRPGDPVLEIGPGKGVLTGLLLESGALLTAVEIDPALARSLKDRYGSNDRFKLINQDFLDFKFDPDPAPGPRGWKVIGNLPYAVVGPILQKVLGWEGWSQAVFMVQKEVGERILASPGGKSYGVLSVSVQTRARPSKVCSVSRGSFRPAPDVDSIVLRLNPLPEPLWSPLAEDAFFAVVRAGFGHRRKTLLNALSYAGTWEPEQIRRGLETAGLPGSIRAERLSIPEFRALAEALSGAAAAGSDRRRAAGAPTP